MQPAPAQSSFLHSVLAALDADWASERVFLARVAVYAADGWSLSQITDKLDVPPVRVRNAIVRLRRVAPDVLREEPDQ